MACGADQIPPSEPHSCRCPRYKQGGDQPDAQHHLQVNWLLAQLSRQQRRLFAAVLAYPRGPRLRKPLNEAIE